MKYFYTIILLLVLGETASAQTNASPYSIIGIGDIESSYFDRGSGMADASISLIAGKFQYNANPASYARMDDHFFSVELSGKFKNVGYTGANIQGTAHSNDFQIERLALAIKIKHWWGIGFGLLPFSSSNYSFTAPKNIIGTGQYVNTTYTGTGGLHKAYLANSFMPIKNLTLGVETQYLWGNLQQEQVMSTSSVAGGTLDAVQNNYLSKVAFKFGALYNGKIAKKWAIGLGATASNKTKLNTDNTITVTDAGQPIVTDSSYNYGIFTLPVMYAFGGHLTYNGKYTLAANYQFQNWADLKQKGLGYSLVNADRLSVGFEYAGLVNNLYEKYYLQAGGYYGHTYLNVNGNPQKDYGLTLGVGLNTTSRVPGAGLMSYQLNLGLGNRGSTNNGGIKETYTTVGFSVIFRDLWGVKQRYE
ncbi:hypothetical protein [Deminuibacter soli]|uniref:Aromatic hydrocarbon degradation protein n=1 Tax=Deminuibacter soli TaxID=2291815 RepID=A0A3E1NRC9_9BACT|nr:hypothetical protein [Deminuibacter soli]RFM30491.1 hypothetical protein DXN05_05920 [Deminuibacter soli]